MIAAMEARSALRGKTFPTLEDKIKAAMRVTKDHWMETDENNQFLAAIEAVFPECSPEDQAKIKDEISMLQMLGAATQGVPVDFSRMPEIKNPIALRRLWAEVKAEA
jgi:hypothetical protein